MFYGTQGGGKAVEIAGNLRFSEKPDCLGFEVGDLVPEEWGITGPFNDDGTQVEDTFISRLDFWNED
tara:strand:+ start:2094 stop:2294 length:201 start_codon:yes stop_codon:yes gene_type:complete